MDIKPDIDLDCAIVWETEREREFALALPQAEPLSRFLALPVHSSRKSMLFVGLKVKDEHGAEIHQTEAVVEWAGAETLHLLFPAAVREAAHSLVLHARESTFAGTVLHIGRPEWREQRPPIPVNDGESLLDIFMNRAFYELDMWHKEPTGSPASTAIGELKQEWNFAALRLLVPKRELGASVAFSRKYDQSLAETQALAVCVSVVPTARFSLNAVIDGKEVALVAGRPGAGLEEIRVPLSGGKLERVTIRLDAESSGEHVAHLLWFMLERRGADPARSHEVTGADDIAPPAAVPDGLPKLAAGLLFGEAELTRLRQTIASGKGRRLYEEILAEAESNLSYRPESYVGRYFPVYWGGQGIERLSSPYQETRRWFSALVYSALAYVLGGELKHGLLARRALLAVIQCEEWCAGFVSRIPRGITGYRATFTEAQLTQAVALCYDMVGGLLSDEEKRAVEDAIYDKSLPALDMYMRRNREGYLLESNQGAVYALGIMYACLVAGRSHPDALTILERQAAWFRRMMNRYYKPDGTTGEGMAYWEYTTHFALETLLLLARHSGEEVSAIAPPQFKESMRYVQHMRSLDDSALTFLPLGDSRAEKFRFMGPSLQFFARYFGDAAAHWMWSRYYDVPHPPASSFFGQEQGTGQYTSNGLLTLLLLEEREAAAPDLPPSFRFDRDRVFWRTGNAESDIALFFEGGPQTFEHTHFDKGEFVIQAFGDYVAADPGMITYDKPEHVYYVQSAYHNIVTIRGANQSYKDAAQAVVLRACESDADASFLRADLANSYKELERYDRMLVFVRPHYFILLDELAAAGGGIEWNFHSCGSFRTEDGKRFVAEGSRAGLVMQVACDVPLTHHMSRYSDEGRTVSHNLVLTPGETATAMNLAAVLAPYPLAGGAPAIDVAGKPVAGGANFTVTGPWGRDRIVVRTGQRQGGSRITVVREGDAGWERSFE
ncbi:MAG: heparinase II/III family protein [Paenibacillaceae bacterium]|nr:heparinase II/III family protein [Paenibacillaceae bacterium]